MANAQPTPPIAAPQPPPRDNVDKVLADMSQMPLFMSELPADTDDPTSTNATLDALRNLAYEGTRYEVASNFKTQGNDCVKTKQYKDAREYYTKALAVLRKEVEGKKGDLEDELVNGTTDMSSQVVDIEEEEKRERVLEETLCVNRALCNLELKNYRQTNTDCAAALTLNPANTKALYRSALASFRLDRLDAALDAAYRAAHLSPKDTGITALETKIRTRISVVTKAATQRREREENAKREKKTLGLALKARNIALAGRVDGVSDIDDASIHLESSLDPASIMVYPVLMLYPTAAQSELLKAVRETETLGAWLDVMLPPPWDEEGKFKSKADVECYMETVQGGLVKVGKKVLLGEVLGGGKAVVRDGIVSVNCLPKDEVGGWIQEFKRRKGR